MDYKKKHEKYSQKNNKKREILSFFYRAKGTIIENDYDVLFNMCLVKYGLRPAFLLELRNYTEPKFNQIIPTIKKIYTEFQYTSEGNDHMFIHVQPLLKMTGNKNEWIGKNLGFYCASSLAYTKKITYSIYYMLRIPNIDPIFFYAEVCDEKKYNARYFSDKLKLFNDFAKKIDWKVDMHVEYRIPFFYYLDYIVKNKLTKEYESHLVQALRGNGSVSLYENIRNNIYTFEDLIKNKKLLLFKILESIYNPLEIFWPLHRELASDLRQIETKIFNTFTKDPMELYEEYINTKVLKDFINGQSNQDVQHMNKIKYKLFSKYKKYLSLM